MDAVSKSFPNRNCYVHLANTYITISYLNTIIVIFATLFKKDYFKYLENHYDVFINIYKAVTTACITIFTFSTLPDATTEPST